MPKYQHNIVPKVEQTLILSDEQYQSLFYTGFPQTFDNWIQGLFKDLQGQQ